MKKILFICINHIENWEVFTHPKVRHVGTIPSRGDTSVLDGDGLIPNLSGGNGDEHLWAHVPSVFCKDRVPRRLRGPELLSAWDYPRGGENDAGWKAIAKK